MMYSFVIKIPLDYPRSPPLMRFSTRISLSCVNSAGYVLVDRVPNFAWDATKNIADLLMAVREAMKDRSSIEASFKLRDQVCHSATVLLEFKSHRSRNCALNDLV